ncbi:MAG: DUF2225 domain-containing protein [Armatimonadetes bacterium]|nr:DUF2225 domain-containing protein [Armatimonadota bacterium]
MTTLITVRLICPVCGTAFSSQAIASTNRVGQDTDFRPHTMGLDPLPHFIHVCPNCCFAAFEGDFDHAEEAVRQHVLSGAIRADEIIGAEPRGALKGSTKYLLAARCYAHDSRATTLRLADLYLRASWCARMEGRRQRERECQTEAVLRFEKALEDGEVAADQLQVTLYLIGELYRRLGLFELAIDYFDRARSVDQELADPRLNALIDRQRAAAVRRRSENMTVSGD